MCSQVELEQPDQTSARPSSFSSDLAILICIALATVIAHMLTGWRYGFHRDELATLDDARHLAWGYVAYPPITPFFGRLSLELFGTSLAGFRFFAALAQAAAVVLTGLIARDLGGRRGAQLLAATAALPFCLAGGVMMQYVSFDYLCWVLLAFFVVRLLTTNGTRWWLAIGCAIGLGMMTKYSMAFFVAGLAGALLLTDMRRHLKSKWLWYGVAVSLLIFLPNLIWQVRHHFISLDFLQHIHARDVRIGRTRDFLPGQLGLMLLAFPLAAAGLYFYLVSKQGKRYRALGWMYAIPLVLFVIARGRSYYMAAGYPMLYAAGSVWGEQWLAKRRRSWAGTIRTLAWTALAMDVALVSAISLPLAPINSALWRFASERNGDLREQLGWPELVQTLASVRDSLPPADRERMGILAANYGEAGAINLYGPQYGLPQAISGVNSFWERGYGNPAPDTLIVVGFRRSFLDRTFTSCGQVAQIPNPYHVKNEEASHPEILVCRGMRQSWPEFWKHFQDFG